MKTRRSTRFLEEKKNHRQPFVSFVICEKNKQEKVKNPNWDGITALHWAAKRVDSSTLVKIDYVFLRKF